MSDTPLTDAQEIIIPAHMEAEDQWNHNGEWVSVDFARGLERKLTEARKVINNLLPMANFKKYHEDDCVEIVVIVEDIRRGKKWMKDNQE